MSVSNTFPAEDFAGATNGVPLPVNFPVLAIGDIYMAKLLVGGTTFINLTPDTDFTRQDLGGGNYTVTPLATYASSIVIRVFRITAPIQPYSFSENGPLPAEEISGMGDRLCMIEQETRLLAGIDGFSMTMPPGSTTILSTVTFADSVARGNAAPVQIGQLGIQINTGALYRATSLAAGGWTAFSTGGATFANPTALVSLAAVNGVSTDAMRADAAPALDPALAPNFTGLWNFSNTTDSTSATSNSAIKTAGGVSIAKALYVGANATLGATSALFFNGNAGLKGAATNRLSVVNNLGTTGFSINMGTADTMIVRSLDNSADGNILGKNLTATGTLGVTGVTTAGDDILINATGKTLKLKSAANGKAGTFTLAAGSATVANTSVTAGSVIIPSVKTVGGTIAGLPVCVPNPGVGFTATGGGADTSTYGYVVFELF